VLSVEDWAEIRRLRRAEGLSIKMIARVMRVSRNTVRAALASDGPPRYSRRPAGSIVDAFEPRIRELLAAFPTMPATVIAERVGWTGSITWFRDNVRRLRPEYRKPDPADRLSWAAGDAAQCDLWFPPRKIPLENGSRVLLPVLVITAAFSRFMLGRMIPTRKTEDLLLATWELLRLLGRVPRRLIWDNEPGIGRGKRHAEGVAGFTGTLATTLLRLPPRDPESKGIVERRNGFFETSFMPGRDFASPSDFNTQFSEWLTRANSRVVRTTKARPVDLLDSDRAAMLPLPPVPPSVGWSNRVRLGRDYYVRVDASDYSVDPVAIGRLIEVHADLQQVQVRLDGHRITRHDRVWARGQTITDPAHVATAKLLRQQVGQPNRVTHDAHQGLVRDLADYDRAFGLVEARPGGVVA
jgi:hypothetical protein